MLWLWISIAAILLILIYIIATFNGFISSKNMTRNAWAQIDVQLKRRADLIPKIVETVKGYAKHERKIFENAAKYRTEYVSAGTAEEKVNANNALARTTRNLFAVAENYPKLMASKNFVKLQEELGKTEDKIAYMREFYNDAVYRYNVSIQLFPANILAKMLGFRDMQLFKLEEARTVPKAF